MKNVAKWLLLPALVLGAWTMANSATEAEAGWRYYRRPVFVGPPVPVPVVPVYRPYPVYRAYYAPVPVPVPAPVYYGPGVGITIGY
jgi:hypothetical protein